MLVTCNHTSLEPERYGGIIVYVRVVFTWSCARSVT